MSTHTFFSLCGPSPVATVKVPLSQPCFDHFFGPCFRGHDEAGLLAFESLQGLPRPCPRHEDKARLTGTRIYILWGYAHASPQNCLFCGPGFGTSFCSILRPLLATYMGEGFGAAGSESFMVEKAIAGSGARAEPLQAAAQSVATGISTVLLWRADAIRHCFLMLALLRPSRRTRQNRNRQQSAASGC